MQEPRREHAHQLLTLLQQRTTRLCLDEGFDLNEARNRSHIGAEYLQHLSFGMLGYAVVAHLAASDRIKTISRQVPPAVGKRIRDAVWSPPDRIYVRVAFNSDEKLLVSHDITDIPQASRNRLRAEIAVDVLEAVQSLPRM
jgi:hypothetical protein